MEKQEAREWLTDMKTIYNLDIDIEEALEYIKQEPEKPDDMVDLLHALFCTLEHSDDREHCQFYNGDISNWIAYTKEARSIFPDLDKAIREAREILNLMETNSTGKRLIKFFTPQH